VGGGGGYGQNICLLFMQMRCIVVDTGKLRETKPEPSLRNKRESPSDVDPMDTDKLFQSLQMSAERRADP
jgi:hypothetical protein